MTELEVHHESSLIGGGGMPYAEESAESDEYRVNEGVRKMRNPQGTQDHIQKGGGCQRVWS